MGSRGDLIAREDRMFDNGEVFESQIEAGKSREVALGVHVSPSNGKVSRLIKPRLHVDYGPMKTNMPILCPVGSEVVYSKGNERILARVEEYRDNVCKAVITICGRKRVVGQENIHPVPAK